MNSNACHLEVSRSARIFNAAVAALTHGGVSVWGCRAPRVRGRRGGECRSTPVNLLSHGGARYLVAPRRHTQWVRNLRAAGSGELVVGRRVARFSAIELVDVDKPAVPRAYLKRWKFEVGAFFDGVGPDASDHELPRIAWLPGLPSHGRVSVSGSNHDNQRVRPIGGSR